MGEGTKRAAADTSAKERREYSDEDGREGREGREAGQSDAGEEREKRLSVVVRSCPFAS
jgi:hypothetical protein